MEIKTDEEIFKALEGRGGEVLEIEEKKVGKKAKNSKKGEIGDDFIGFVFSDDEKNEESEQDHDNDEDDERGFESFDGKESSKSKNGGKRSHSDRKDDKESSKKVDLSEEVKKKLGRLFHPRAPWFPINYTNRELAEHYGYLSAPQSRRKHFSERLHQELKDLAHYLSPTRAEEAARALVVRKCDAVVRKLFPGNKVECFGSFETGLYLPTSDIDLVVIPDLRSGGLDSMMDDSERPPPLRKLARALIKAGIADPRSVQVIAKARVPIIKFVDRLTGHPVDISFNVASGLDGARFLKEQLQLYPALRPLLLFLKLFLDLRGLNEVFKGGLGSFSAACLLISFFQLHPLIQLGYIRAEDNLGILLLEFLELYGKSLYYEKVGISVGLDRNSAEIRVGAEASVSLISAIDVPYGYYDKMDRGFYNESRPGLLSIQDPQSPSNDLARPSFSISSVRQAFEHAFNLLTAAAHEIDSADSKQHQHNNFHNHHRTDGSLLAALINIPEAFLKHRDYIKRTIIPK